MSTLPWKEADVHCWSTRMSQVATDAMPGLAAESRTAALRCDPAAIVSRLTLLSAKRAVDKIFHRRTLGDSDLCGTNPLGMLQLIWEEIDICDASDVSALEELLVDVGQTCLQGDTHRIFSHLLAIRRSREDVETCKNNSHDTHDILAAKQTNGYV
jgi:hypothetical protein